MSMAHHRQNGSPDHGARNFVFLISSARRGGNTEWLARCAAETIPTEHSQSWLRLADLPLAPFVDLRHEDNGYDQPTGNEAILLQATLDATDLVFVTPLYWYSIPSIAKNYLDHWSKWLRVPGVEFRKRMEGKTLWVVCVLADRNPQKAEPLVLTFKIIAPYLKMTFGGLLLGNGSRRGDVIQDLEAVDKARSFFSRTYGAEPVL